MYLDDLIESTEKIERFVAGLPRFVGEAIRQIELEFQCGRCQSLLSSRQYRRQMER